jgi:hypothetical protein
MRYHKLKFIFLLFLTACQTTKPAPNGYIFCYDPKSWDEVYKGPFYGAVALDNAGKGAILFRAGEDELAQTITGANCLIRYVK